MTSNKIINVSPGASTVVAILLTLVATALALDETKVIYGVVGGTAFLPCNITPPMRNDSVRLVLWYKDSKPQPVYSFDSRFSTVKHWSEDEDFGPRSYFRDSSIPAQLIISSITMEDQGLFKCRVDFQKSPTLTTSKRLIIVEKPLKPIIIDSDGSTVMGTIGPFELNAPLILICLVEGGTPEPQVVWFKDGELFDNEKDPSTYNDVLQNTLVVSALNRSFYNSLLECKAINNNVTVPPSANVKVSLKLPILKMSLSKVPKVFTADKTFRIVCEVHGVQPEPVIAWTLGSQMLQPLPTRFEAEQNMYSSELIYSPKIQDDQQNLTCVAETKYFQKKYKAVTLNVQYVPIVQVIMNEMPEAEDDVYLNTVREKQDVSLECLVDASPPAHRVLWYFNGEEVVQSEKTILANRRLELKEVSKDQSGSYVCSASNVVGDGFSEPFQISVNYKPVCLLPKSEYKNSSQKLELTCQVDSQPISNTYRWIFNNSFNQFEIPNAKSIMEFNNYKPTHEDGHGQVFCWASNDLGEQMEPCIFHVMPLGAPQKPDECQVSNQTSSTITVSCRPGFSGGFVQTFVFSVFETNSNNNQSLISTTESQNSTVTLKNLSSGTNYIISVMSVNERGNSSAVFLGAKTLNFFQSLPKTSELSRQPFLFVILAFFVALIIISLIFSLVSFRKTKKAKKAKKKEYLELKHPKAGADKQSNVVAHDVLRKPLVASDKPEKAVTFIQASRPEPAKAICKCEAQQLMPPGSSSTSPDGPTRPAPIEKTVRRSRFGLPVKRTVVQTYSIEKLRPICPTCNPGGTTPYPETNSLDQVLDNLVSELQN